MNTRTIYDEYLKAVVDLRSATPLSTLSECPNTFDAESQTYVWKHFDCFDYAIVPREFEEFLIRVDVYLAMDEDDADDMDLRRTIEGIFSTLAEDNRFSVAWMSDLEEIRRPKDLV